MTEINHIIKNENAARNLTGADIDPSLANMKSITSIDQAMKEVELSPAEIQDDTRIKAKIFELARALLNFELCTDSEIKPSQKIDIVKEWWSGNAIPWPLDAEMNQEICNAVLKAELPIFNSPMSYCRAIAEKQIDEQYGHFLDIKRKNMLLLKKTLYELQTLTGPKPYYASAKKLEESLGNYSSKHWWEMLNRLEVDEDIRKISNGKFKGRKASEFITLKHPCWKEDDTAKATFNKLMQSTSTKHKVLKSVRRRREMSLILNANLGF